MSRFLFSPRMDEIIVSHVRNAGNKDPYQTAADYISANFATKVTRKQVYGRAYMIGALRRKQFKSNYDARASRLLEETTPVNTTEVAKTKEVKSEDLVLLGNEGLVAIVHLSRYLSRENKITLVKELLDSIA